MESIAVSRDLLSRLRAVLGEHDVSEIYIQRRYARSLAQGPIAAGWAARIEEQLKD